jgi:hypothetical protein
MMFCLNFRWLLNKDPHSVEAKSVIRKLRGFRHEREIESEVLNFLSASLVHKTARPSAHSSGAMFDLLLDRTYRPLLTAVIGLQVAQQLCGINAVFYYSTGFFQGVLDNPLMGTCLVNFVNVVATFVAMKLMDTTNRRTLLLWSSGGMAFSCALLTVSSLGYTYNSMALLSVMLFVTFFEIGLGPIPFLIVAEFFDAKYVATAMSMACIVNWACNFLVGFFFPMLQEALGPYTFVPFAGVLVCAFLFTLFYVTESFGRSVSDVHRLVGIHPAFAAIDEAEEGVEGRKSGVLGNNHSTEYTMLLPSEDATAAGRSREVRDPGNSGQTSSLFGSWSTKASVKGGNDSDTTMKKENPLMGQQASPVVSEVQLIDRVLH